MILRAVCRDQVTLPCWLGRDSRGTAIAEVHCVPQRGWWVRRAHRLTGHLIRLERKGAEVRLLKDTS